MIVTVMNSKGGVAKTTTSVNLSAALAMKGKRTLLVDLDQQCNASQSLGISPEDITASSADVVLGDLSARQAIHSTSTDGLDVLPASIELAQADLALANVKGRESRLVRALDPVRADYNFILIDCPPSLSLLPINALLAADWYLIPVMPHYLALEGLVKLLTTMRMMQEGMGGTAQLLGILLTLVDYRTSAMREIVELIRNNYRRNVFEAEVRTNTRLAEAPSHGKTIFQYDPTSTGAQAYEMLADEVLKRTKKHK